MSDQNIELTRRKILGSVGAVGAAGAAAGLGTSALFSDTESFESNTLAAGELDLKVDWEEHYSYPQLYGFDDPAATLDVTRTEPDDTSTYVGMPDPEDPVVWVHESDLDAYMSNTAIEAYPDPDDDGEQEIETDSFSYEPCSDGADLAEDLDVSGLRTDNEHTDPEGDGGSPPLIQLQDVKPGDFGEFTLSFHLCDNPGYVWLQAANFSESEGTDTEPENEVDNDNAPDLAENIRTVWWYDARGDNVPPRTDCEEKIYLTDTGGSDATKLYEVSLDDNNMDANLTQILPDGNSTDITNGNFTQTDAIAATPNGDKIVFYDKNSGHLGEYDVNTGAFIDKGSIGSDPGGVVLAGYSPSGTLWAASQDDDHLYTVDRSGPSVTDQGDTGVNLSGADLAFAADGTLYLWTSSSQNGLYNVDDPSSDTTAVPVDSSNIGDMSTDVTGMAIRDGGSGDIVVSDNAEDEIIIIDRTDGSRVDGYAMQKDGGDFDHVFGDMTAGQLCGEVFRRGNAELQGTAENLKDDIESLESSPAPLDGNRASEFTEFGGSGEDPSRECFPAGVTHYIGFGWWLPETVGNEVQGDSVSFDLGFYTEQCRNNDGSGT
jgi:predicted ribosomally synthesized peptide with SipW-like signal peptide